MSVIPTKAGIQAFSVVGTDDSGNGNSGYLQQFSLPCVETHLSST